MPGKSQRNRRKEIRNPRSNVASPRAKETIDLSHSTSPPSGKEIALVYCEQKRFSLPEKERRKIHDSRGACLAVERCIVVAYHRKKNLCVSRRASVERRTNQRPWRNRRVGAVKRKEPEELSSFRFPSDTRIAKYLLSRPFRVAPDRRLDRSLCAPFRSVTIAVRTTSIARPACKNNRWNGIYVDL